MVLPDLPPEPECERKIAVRKRDRGSRDQGITRAVHCTRAACECAGLGAAAAPERRKRASPGVGSFPFDGQYLSQVRPAATAAWPLDASGPARRAAFKPTGHRWSSGGGNGHTCSAVAAWIPAFARTGFMHRPCRIRRRTRRWQGILPPPRQSSGHRFHPESPCSYPLPVVTRVLSGQPALYRYGNRSNRDRHLNATPDRRGSRRGSA